MANVVDRSPAVSVFECAKLYAKCIALPTHVHPGIDGTAHQVPREREKTELAFFPKPPTYFLIYDKRESFFSFCQPFSLSTAGLSGCILESLYHPCKLLLTSLCEGHRWCRNTRGVRRARLMCQAFLTLPFHSRFCHFSVLFSILPLFSRLFPSYFRVWHIVNSGP